MDKSRIINQQLKKAGSTVILKEGEWSSTPFRAVIQHLWRKKSSNFESIATELGFISPQYYLYIGPSNHNIKALGENAQLVLGTESYEFKFKDVVNENDKALYYTGILRKTGEAE